MPLDDKDLESEAWTRLFVSPLSLSPPFPYQDEPDEYAVGRIEAQVSAGFPRLLPVT